MEESTAGLSDEHHGNVDVSGEPTSSSPNARFDVITNARTAQNMSASSVVEPVIDFRFGEAIVIFDILVELSKHRDLPLRVCGKNLGGRPTIHVTLTKPIGDVDADRSEYKNGRALTIRQHGNHETEHFAFEWVAPR